jgi:predicted metalloprotease
MRRLGVAALCFVLAGFVVPVRVAPPALAQESGTPTASGVEGNSYRSPDFGYTLTWDDTWQVADESIEPGYNMLRLDNGVSGVYLEGYVVDADAQSCLNQQVDSLRSTSGVSDVAQAQGSDGSPMGGGDASDAWAVYDFTYTGTDGKPNQLSGFFECVVLSPGASVLVITQIVPADSYNDQIAPRVALLTNLVLPGSAVAPTATAGSSSGQAPIMSRDDLALFLQRAADDIDGFWAHEFPALSGGMAYAPPRDFVPYDTSVASACNAGAPSVAGPIDKGDGPFYCSADDTVYMDLLFAEDQLAKFGPFPVAEAIAHEVGHHVQYLLGMQTCEMSPCLDPTQLTSQELETMADCFAGAWSRDAEQRGRLGNFDIEENIAQYAIAFNYTANASADPGAHGRGALRVYWFLEGYYFGSSSCLNASPATAPQTAPATTPTASAGALPPGAFRRIGDTYQAGPLAITVTGTDVQTSIAGDATSVPPAEGKYLLVYFTLVVSGEQSRSFNYDSLVVIDSSGQGYLHDPVATNAVLKPSVPNGTEETLQPGVPYNLAIVFDVPKTASGFVLRASDGSFPVQLDQ